MIKDSTKELMDEQALIPQNDGNQWLNFLNTGIKPKPALEGRLKPEPKTRVVSTRQQRGTGNGK